MDTGCLFCLVRVVVFGLGAVRVRFVGLVHDGVAVVVGGGLVWCRLFGWFGLGVGLG